MDVPKSKCKKCTARSMAKETSDIKVAFFMVLQLVIKRFSTIMMVDPQLLVQSLPTAIMIQLLGVLTIDEIFRPNGPLDGALSWCNFRILVKLVDQFGDQKCKHALNEYITLLGHYVRSRSWLINTELLPESISSTGKGSTALSGRVMLVIDPEWDERLLQNETSKECFASILQKSPDQLYFTSVQ